MEGTLKGVNFVLKIIPVIVDNPSDCSVSFIVVEGESMVNKPNIKSESDGLGRPLKLSSSPSPACPSSVASWP